jgi:hypothetical protein
VQTSINLIKITQQISQCLSCYSSEIRTHKNYQEQSSGLKVQNIGQSRYWLLKIHYQILHVLENTDSETSAKYDLKAAVPMLLPLLEECLTINRWNNIAQKLIIDVLRLYLKTCYSDFQGKELATDKVSQGFFGFLIETFRNKCHIFLDSMNFTSQGDRHTIFEISHLISVELHNNHDLLTLTEKLPEWREFMGKDLLDYARSCYNKLYYDES